MIDIQRHSGILAALVIFQEYNNRVIDSFSAHNNAKLLCAFRVIPFLA